jgi:phosphoglycolate phosphatase
MNKLSKKLIIFDMDGTLIDSGDAISNTINFVRTNIGLKPMPKVKLLQNINNPDINSAEYFYGTKEFTPQQTELFGKYYDEHCVSDIVIYDGIKELVTKLSKTHILCVATNASKQFAIKMLDSVDILEYFDMVAGYTCVAKPKPAPDMLQLICDNLNIDIKDSVLIGDSLKDKQSANAINMDSILVNWGFSQDNAKYIQSVDKLDNLLQ